jgi:hypothetical protein
MKKALRIEKKELYHFVEGVRVAGAPSGLWGNVDELWGDVSGLWGDVSGLWGNVSGLSGDVSGLRGNVDECEITDDDRAEGVNISDLIEEED